MGVLGGDTRRSHCQHTAIPDQIVDALGALPMPTLDQYRGAADCDQPLALAFDCGLALRKRLVQQSGGLGKIRRDQRCAGYEFCT